jgi:hypothetical protein
VSKITGKFLTYDSRNTLNINAQKYQMRLKVIKGIDEFISKVDFINIWPAQPKA